MPDTFETRTVEASFEMRDADTTNPTLEGYAATFNQEYDLGPFREKIDPSAFNRTLGTGPDVRLLVDHEGQPLARTKSGTLQIIPDSTGLHVRASLDPSDPDVQRLLPKMRRGDLDQMSFAFRVPAGGDTWTPDYTLRTLTNVELSGGDVSVVTYPANPATSVSVRAKDTATAYWLLVERMACDIREQRVGAELSAQNVAKLKQILDLIAAADTAVDKAQPALAALIGVPNPDAKDSDANASDTEPAQANSGRPLGLALAVATRLAV